MRNRENLFLQFMKKGIYENEGNPYLKLLNIYNIGFKDIRGYVMKSGVEGSLKWLRDKGVYITLDEFKCRVPIIRKGEIFKFQEVDFDNPFLLNYVRTMTGGTRGRATRTKIDLDFLTNTAMHEALMFEVCNKNSAPRIVWIPCMPLHTGLVPLRYCKLARPPSNWYSQIDPSGANIKGLDFKTKIIAFLIHNAPRVLGIKCPLPEYLGFNNADIIAKKIEENINRFSGCIVFTFASSALKICLAAKEKKINIKGVWFITCGEPLTTKKKQIIESMGAAAISAYYFTEFGLIGCGCGNASEYADDMHLFNDHVAIIQRKRDIKGSGIFVDAFLFTSLLPSSPKIMLNVENGDYGIIKRKNCGCKMDQYGYLDHIADINSFEKLTSEGMTFLGADLARIIEEVLPQRFGGGSTDYQLVEEEVNGKTILNILAHPRLGALSENDIIAAFKNEIKKRNPKAINLLLNIWSQAGTLNVKRQEPLSTPQAKIYPVHILRKK